MYSNTSCGYCNSYAGGNLPPCYGNFHSDYASSSSGYQNNEKYDSHAPMVSAMKMVEFSPNFFVREETKFVATEDEIMPYVEEAFKLTTGKELPADFTLKLCDTDELVMAHNFFNGIWNNGIQGFCINRKGFGTSRVFVKKDDIARMLLTIGHELGHLQTNSLKGVEEEAKAFAFSIEWMKKIKENNIAGLENVIVNEMPAENGLHNIAFDYVIKLLHQDMNPMEIFEHVVNGAKVAS